MVEANSPTDVAPKKPAFSLSISVPGDEETPEKKQGAGDPQQQPATGTSQATSGRVSSKGEGRTSARGDGTGRVSGRTSARGGVSARGTIPKSVFCHEAVIKGNVIFGEGCIVHPGAQIKAEGGDIIMGDFNIIEEYV